MMEEGTTVKVREDLIPNESYGGVRFTAMMKEYCGKTAIISGVERGWRIPHYRLNIDEGQFHWTEEMLEEVVVAKYEASVKDLQFELWMRLRNSGRFTYKGTPITKLSDEQLEDAIADLLDHKFRNEG